MQPRERHRVAMTRTAFAWAADSRKILIQSADAGADAAGSAATARIGGGDGGERPSWMPTVEISSSRLHARAA